MSWIEEKDKQVICDICDSKSDDLKPVKINDVMLSVCDKCIEKKSLTPYDGSDWASDWN